MPKYYIAGHAYVSTPRDPKVIVGTVGKPQEGIQQSQSANNGLLSCALWYATNFSWRVLPVRPAGKHPLIKNWPALATCDPNQILRWWTQWPDANIGIATGHGLEVFDVDYEAGGDKYMRQLRESGSSPTTPTVETARGCHHYFKAEGNRNRVAILPGLDWRGENGFVIAPPSLHPTGAVYQWSI